MIIAATSPFRRAETRPALRELARHRVTNALPLRSASPPTPEDAPPGGLRRKEYCAFLPATSHRYFARMPSQGRHCPARLRGVEYEFVLIAWKHGLTIHVAPPVSPEACPALVLNADYRPLSYYPLSLWCWQDAIKAVFMERVNIVSEYERRVRSPSFEMRLPSVVSLKTYVKPPRHPGLHTVQRVPARLFHLPILRSAGGSDLRPCRAALEGRAYGLGKCRCRLCAVQSSQRGLAALRIGHVAGGRSLTSRRSMISIRTAGTSRRTTCTRAGWTIFIGMPSSSRRSLFRARIRGRLRGSGARPHFRRGCGS